MADDDTPPATRPLIRSCRIDEADVVLDVWARAGAHPTVTDDAESLRHLMAHDADALLVAERDRHVVATLIAAWDGWRGAFYRLAVVPEMRRQGIARALVDEGERRLRRRGARRLAAIVVPSDAPAVTFWESAGYARQQERWRYVKNVRDD